MLLERTYNNTGKNTESGTEIETKISGLLSFSNFMINVQRNESEDRFTLKCMWVYSHY